MELSGVVQGEAARRYPDYTYRKPVITNLDAWSFDPERLHPAYEYPRSVNPPSNPNIKTIELANYVVRFGVTGNDGMNPVQVWMQPNEYTVANKPLLVCEFKVSNTLTLQREIYAEVLRLAFA